ncbi:hypothetical protein [Acetobacter okinawensis]|uniref:hypothetical protein n=1 Tax=Acetobacter okinawensis TaxID=1076594 RepID=UPI0015D8F084|nr:hypothetical protein [Acetobacter okinawensis]
MPYLMFAKGERGGISQTLRAWNGSRLAASGAGTISSLNRMSVPVFVFQNADNNTVAVWAKMVAEDSLTLAADTLYDINHVLFFCDCRKPFDLKNIEKILAHFAQEASSPPAACDCNMNIRACVHVKQHARDYLAVPLQTHASEGREKLHSKRPLHKGR